MTRKTMTIMAVMLLVATAATAATAFAGTKHRCMTASSVSTAWSACGQAPGFDPVMQQVVNANNAASQAILRLKLKPPPRVQRGVGVLIKPAGYASRPNFAMPIMRLPSR